MNKHKILTAVLGTALIVVACKKADLQNEFFPKTSSSASEWKSLTDWSSQSEENYTVYTTTIEDKTITSDIASQGLVLAYKKTSGSTVALPCDEKGSNGSYFWYYQISDGNIVFSADAYGKTNKPGRDQGFAYYIISPDKLNDLQTKGYSKAQLMKLTYEEASKLLK